MDQFWGTMVRTWTALTAEMQTRDWIDLFIALGTIGLAGATFRLATHAGQAAQDSRAALEAFKKQASAGEALADIARLSLEEQREQARRQTRAHVVWLDSDESENYVADDPATWSSEESSGTAIVLQAKVRNLGAIPAYLDAVRHGSELRLVVIDPQTLAGGAEAHLTLYLLAEPGKKIQLAAPLSLEYQSVASGESARSDAILHVSATVVPQSPNVVSAHAHVIDGFAFESAADARPRAQSAK